jgi:hypothetical protein
MKYDLRSGKYDFEYRIENTEVMNPKTDNPPGPLKGEFAVLFYESP